MEYKNEVNYELVVVGGGNAGLCCAVEAANLGLNVLLIEKAPKERRGGNSRFTGGVWRVACEKGSKDIIPLLEPSTLPVAGDRIDIEPYTKDAYYADLMRVSKHLAEKEWSEMIVETSLPAVYWLKAQGVKFELTVTNQRRVGDRVAVPAGTHTMQTLNRGEGLVEMLYGIAESKGVPVMYNTMAQSLITNAEGEVTGVIAKGPEGILRVNAKSVVLACGGYEANPEMRRRYLGEGWDLAKVRGTRYNTGDGLKMSMDIGAQPCGHWGICHASVVSEDSPQMEAERSGCIRYSYPYCIMVNINGERFVDEGENYFGFTYAKMGRQINKQPDGLAFQIFDAKTTPLLQAEYLGADRAEANTLEELAESIGVDSQKLIKTIKQYNESIDASHPFTFGLLDGRRTHGLEYDKTNWAQAIDTPPYWAFAVVCGVTFSFGGIKINEKTQVINTQEFPIEGLYAVGEVPGGLFYYNYGSGTGLVKGVVTGRIAAQQSLLRARKVGSLSQLRVGSPK